MSTPITRIRIIANDTPEADIDTPAKRLALSGSVVTTGSGNELDFGTADISGGDTWSNVGTAHWDITDDGLNTACSAFKLWVSNKGFGSTIIYFEALSGDDGTPVLTEEYIVDAIYSDYTKTVMPASEPGSQNLWPTDEGTSMLLGGDNGPSDDTVMFAICFNAKAVDTPGIYKGTDSGYELQFSFKYTYS